MQISPLDPGTSPLSAEQSAAVNQLVASLTPVQVAWLGGYLSGVAGYTQSLAGLLSAGAPGAVPMPAAGAASGSAETITVLYGTQTGNCEKVAKELAAKAAEKGLTVDLKDMGSYRHQALKKEKFLLVIVSTHGEGDPPDRVMELHGVLHSNRAPKLKDLDFSVLALGDRTYQHYCKIGKDFDAKLEELGGSRIYDRVDCDVDYEDAADGWIDGVLAVLEDKAGASAPAGQPAPGGFPMLAGIGAAAPAASKYNKKNPFAARLLDKIQLNDEGSAKQTLHVELSLEDSGLQYLPGDSLGVFPTNNPDTVDLLLQTVKIDGDEQITMHNGEGGTIRDLLAHHVEINALTPDVVEKYAELGDIDDLRDLLKEDNFQQLHDYLHGRDVIDLLQEHPVELYANDLAECLRKLPPRLYSIASSLEAYPEEVHLCIAAVRYESHGREREGVCSTYFADRAPIDAEVPVYVHENNYFRLPDSQDTPIIMIGPGTGVAPFRAFLQHREMLEAEGDSWLFFGEQHFRTDFLYQAEWLQFLDTGVLTRMDVAFSRDQEEKVYVQHRMKERSAELYEWLEKGAHLYVCGDESRMAHDVHAALIDIIAQEGKKSADEADAYIKNLQKNNRYQRDVY